MSPDALLSQAWPEPPHLGDHTQEDVRDVQNVDRAMVRDAQGIVGVQREDLICPGVREVFSEEASLSQILEDRLVFTRQGGCSEQRAQHLQRLRGNSVKN